MKISSYNQALSYLYSFIPQKRKYFAGEKGMLRTKYLLQLLSNPQEKIKVIHIAGTSGKGSTAYLTSLLLVAHGFKVGLQVSPHLLDIRERFQINNQLISKEQFTQFVAGIMPYVERAKKTKWGRLTYFEINVCLAFYIFF
jgi:dihydrofolate synthase/folylpolyglutamate synthase